jgi:hypothetical protein
LFLRDDRLEDENENGAKWSARSPAQEACTRARQKNSEKKEIARARAREFANHQKKSAFPGLDGLLLFLSFMSLF